MWYIVRLDSSRVATLDKVRSSTLSVKLYTSKNYDFTANRTLPVSGLFVVLPLHPGQKSHLHVARSAHCSRSASTAVRYLLLLRCLGGCGLRQNLSYFSESVP